MVPRLVRHNPFRDVRVYARGFVHQLRNMAAFDEYSQPNLIALELNRLAVSVRGHCACEVYSSLNSIFRN